MKTIKPKEVKCQKILNSQLVTKLGLEKNPLIINIMFFLFSQIEKSLLKQNL